LGPELVFRQVPGKSRQRRRRPRRRRALILRPLRDPSRRRVLRVAPPPRRLRPLAQLRAAQRRARALALAYARVRG